MNDKKHGMPTTLPMPLGKDLGQLQQEANQARIVKAVSDAPKYSKSSSFDCSPLNGWLIVEEVDNSPGKIILPDSVKFPLFRILAIGVGPFTSNGELLWTSGDDEKCPYAVGDIIVSTGPANAHMFRGVTVLSIIYHQVQYVIEYKGDSPIVDSSSPMMSAS